MQGECSRRRCPERQGFAKVSCDTGDPEASLGEKALDLVTMSNNSVGGEAVPVAPAPQQLLQIQLCEAGLVLDPWRCLKLYEVKGKFQESACKGCISHIFFFRWRLLSACSPLCPKQLCVREP